jgi:hypothetical protein
VRGVVAAASTPHAAVIAAIAALVLIDHAVRVRATRSGAVCWSRLVASSGLKTPMQVTRPSWTAMTSSIPGTPGRTNASPTGQHARSTPETRSTLCAPNRAASGRARREPTKPPTPEEAASARAYCQGENPRRPSMSTASSGSAAMIRPLTTIALRSSGRRVGWARR